MKKCISIFLSFLLLSIAPVVSAEPAMFSVAADGTSILEFEDYASDFPLPVRMGAQIKPENEASGGDYVYVVSHKMDVADLPVPITVEQDGYYDVVFTATKGSWLSEFQVLADDEETPFFLSSTASGTSLDNGTDYFYHNNSSGGRDFPGVRFYFTMYLSKGAHTLTFRFFGREAFNNTIAFCVDSFALTPSRSIADSLVIGMTGITDDPDVKGATVMMVKKGTDRTKLTPEDVLYVDQSDIAEDGSYRIQLPFIARDRYDFYSNMGNFGFSGEEKDSLYVSETGNDENDGSKDAPYLTLAKAYESIESHKRIMISGSVAYTDAPSPYSGTVHIVGTSGATLVLPAEISLNGALTLESLNTSGAATVFANGKSFTVEDTDFHRPFNRVRRKKASRAYRQHISYAFRRKIHPHLRWRYRYGYRKYPCYAGRQR